MIFFSLYTKMSDNYYIYQIGNINYTPLHNLSKSSCPALCECNEIEPNAYIGMLSDSDVVVFKGSFWRRNISMFHDDKKTLKLINELKKRCDKIKNMADDIAIDSNTNYRYFDEDYKAIGNLRTSIINSRNKLGKTTHELTGAKIQNNKRYRLNNVLFCVLTSNEILESDTLYNLHNVSIYDYSSLLSEDQWNVHTMVHTDSKENLEISAHIEPACWHSVMGVRQEYSMKNFSVEKSSDGHSKVVFKVRDEINTYENWLRSVEDIKLEITRRKEEMNKLRIQWDSLLNEDYNEGNVEFVLRAYQLQKTKIKDLQNKKEVEVKSIEHLWSVPLRVGIYLLNMSLFITITPLTVTELKLQPCHLIEKKNIISYND